FDVEIVDLAIVTREIDDQSFADRISNQTGAGATWRDRNGCVGCRFDDGAGFFRAARKGCAGWFDLVNRGVGRVKLPRQIIEANVAAGSGDRFSLSGGDWHARNLPHV